MITQTLRLAHELDPWLDRRFGAPYRALLAVGLGVELVRQSHELIEASGQMLRLLPILLDAALLLHTADALHESWERHLTRAAHRRRPPA